MMAFFEKLLGPPKIETLVEKRDIRGLISALAYKTNAGLRADAAAALKKLGSYQALTPLISALKDPSSIVRIQAVWAVAELAGVDGIEAIETVFENSDPAVCRTAIDALVNIGGGRAVRVILKALSDSDPDVQQAAVDALKEIKTPDLISPLIGILADRQRSARQAAVTVLTDIGTAAAPALYEALSDENPLVRQAAASVLGRIKPSGALAPLIAATRDRVPHVRRIAALAIGRFSDRRAVSPLVALLKDGAVEVRQAAARSLGTLGDPDAVKPLTLAFKEAPEQMASSSGPAIIQIGNTAVDPLIALLENPDAFLCPYIILWLGEIRDNRAAAALITFLRNKNFTLRHVAAEALEKIGWQPTDDETGASYWIAKQDWNRCMEMGTNAIAPLCELLENSKPELRCVVAQLLEAMGWQPGNDARGNAFRFETNLRKLKGTSVKEVQAAAEALGWSGRSEAAAPLCKALNFTSGFEDTAWKVRQTTAHALGRLGNIEAVGPLIFHLYNDPHTDVRLAIIDALGTLGDIRAKEDLCRELKSDHDDLCAAAARALGKIGDSGAVQALFDCFCTVMDNPCDLRDAVLWALKKNGDAAIAFLIPMIEMPEEKTFRGAVSVLSEIGGTAAIKPLVSILRDEKKENRLIGLEAVLKQGAPALEHLIDLLKNGNFVGRLNAVIALGKIGDDSVRAPLLETLRDRNDTLAREAAHALETLGWHPGNDSNGALYWILKKKWGRCASLGDAAVEPLLEKLPDADKKSASAMGETLGRIGKRRSVPGLIEILRNGKKEYHRTSAAVALGNIGYTQSIPALVDALAPGGELQSAAEKALALIGVRAVEPLLAALDSPDSVKRCSAARVLGNIGNGRAVEPLSIVLLGKDISLAMEAANALGKIGDARAMEPLSQMRMTSNPELREAVVSALGGIDSPDTVPLLLQSLGDSTWAVRHAAAYSLVWLYKNDKLTEEHKALVLDRRGKIISGHADVRGRSHSDYPNWHDDDFGYSDRGHSDSPAIQERDYGIGVDFPLKSTGRKNG